MGIVNRIKRLAKADVHGILDVIEEPKIVLKQAIREMEEALEQKQSQVSGLATKRQQLRDRVRELETLAIKSKESVALSMKENKSDLAKKTIAQDLGLRKEFERVTNEIGRFDNLFEQQTRDLEMQKVQLKAVTEKARLFVETEADDSAGSVAQAILAKSASSTRNFCGNVTEEEIEIEFLRLQQTDVEGSTS